MIFTKAWIFAGVTSAVLAAASGRDAVFSWYSLPEPEIVELAE